MSRDPNAMIGGAVYALTAITAVRPGCERKLRKRLRAWRKPYSPFVLLPSTHFARLVIIDRLAFEGPPSAQPPIPQQYLLFSATFDGDSADGYLEEMCRRIPDKVESVFGLCTGAPRPVAADPAAFRNWIAGHQVETRAFFAHSPEATVPAVRDARALSEAVRSFAMRTRYDRPDVLQRRFEEAFGP